MKTYKQRIIQNKISELFGHYPVVAVLGARQVGKSTLVENLFRDSMGSVVFDPVVDIENARLDPEFFLQNHPPPVFLDEIQYAPELLGPIKRRIDLRRENSQYILSASQNLSLLRNISESLAGRVAVVNLLPMTRREISGEIHPSFLETWLSNSRSETPDQETLQVPLLYPSLWQGGYPKIMELPDHLISNYWESYLQTYIERDVRTVANIGSLQSFGQFISLLAALSSQEINHTHLGRELGIDRKTALAWTQIAEATFLWHTIPPFSRNAVKKIAGRAKGYFSDTGFLCYLQRISSPEAIGGHPLKGSLFETYIVMEIMKTMQAWPMRPNLYHFRSYGGAEVDLILEMNGRLYPIEIKAKSNPSRNDGRGIGAFRACFPTENIGPGLILCAVEQPLPLDDNLMAIPWWYI